MVMDHQTSEKEFYCLVLSTTGPLAVLMVMDQWKGEVYCLFFSSGPLAVLIVMDCWTSGKEFCCLVLSTGPLAVSVVMDHRTGVLRPGPFQWSTDSFNGHGPVERRGQLHGPFYWSAGTFDDYRPLDQ